MILAEENGSTRRKTRSLVTLLTREDRYSFESCTEIEVSDGGHRICFLPIEPTGL